MRISDWSSDVCSSDRVQARVSCLAEAVERYACGWTGSEPRRSARIDEFGAEAVHPSGILGFSERQYAERATRNAGADPMHLIPEPFREDRKSTRLNSSH